MFSLLLECFYVPIDMRLWAAAVQMLEPQWSAIKYELKVHALLSICKCRVIQVIENNGIDVEDGVRRSTILAYSHAPRTLNVPCQTISSYFSEALLLHNLDNNQDLLLRAPQKN